MTRKIFTACASILTIVSIMITSCDKPEPAPLPEEQTNFFTYEDYSFDINSVVKYEKGDNAIELWLSPDFGLTSTSAIEKAGDYIVLNTNKDYLNKRDRFNAATSKGSFIRFGNDKEFAYGDTGTAYIEVSISGETIDISFMAQKLYTKAEATVKAVVQGTYSGSYVTEQEKPYENEWGLDRNRSTISGATYTTYENGSDSEIILYDEDSRESVKLTLKPSSVGKQIYFPTTGNISLEYNGGVLYDLTKASGMISTSMTDTVLEVAIDVTDGNKRIRASYKGEYANDMVKENRYKYQYDGESAYEGRHEIVKLMVENKAGQCKLFFSPSEGYTMDKANSTHMPILTVPSSLINAGRKSFLEIEGWEFAFDLMQVWPYNDEYQPHPAETDWIEINYDGNAYEVEFILTSIAKDMPSSTMDLYFQGTASK